MNKKILVTRIFPEPGMKLLREAGFSLTIRDEDRPMTEKELIERTMSHDVLYCTLTEKIDKPFLEACSHLEIVSQFAVGYDNIDIEAATRLGIPVGNTPDVLSEATADIAFGLMIAVSRKMFFNHKRIARGEWGYFVPNAHLGMELKGKTLGIHGLGRIGLEMARRCRGAYDMKIIYHNRKRNETAENELNAEYVDFEQLLSHSDVLSVHCALTEQTRDVYDKDAFSMMKPTSILINTARGPMHNEEDLLAALQQGVIWGAGLDVTNPEPMQTDNPLLDMENVAVLPHIGSATQEARSKMSILAAENIIGFYKNGQVPHLVNPGFSKV